MITQRLMKPGSFRVELINEYPTSIATAVDLFDHIVITASRLQPISGFTDATILDSAIFTGVITRKGSPRIFEGSDVVFWLGSPEGLGDLLDTAVTNSADTLTNWVTDLCPSSLTVGTVTNTSAHTGSYQWMTRREALDAVCRASSSEYRVNPDFTIDAGAISDLFVTTPTVVVTRREEGQDGPYRGLDGGIIVMAKDVEEYSTKVFVMAAGEGGTIDTYDDTGSTTYKDGLNNSVVLERLVDAPNITDATAGANLAAAMVAQFNTVRRELSISSKTYTVTRFVKPGDHVYVWDPLAELVDTANQIVYRGDVISPIKLRVHGLSWPLERGVGVYARRSGATPTYTDLTDWVQWEDGADVQWDVGSAPRPMNTPGLGQAYLGENPPIVERASR